MRTLILAFGLALAVGGCASSGTASGDQTPTSRNTARRLNVISAEEIRESGAANSVADVIRQLRPGWPVNVAIFMNNDPFGGYDSLRNISIGQAREIRFLSKSEAQMKWGSRYQEVIQIITR